MKSSIPCSCSTSIQLMALSTHISIPDTMIPLCPVGYHNLLITIHQQTSQISAILVRGLMRLKPSYKNVWLNLFCGGWYLTFREEHAQLSDAAPSLSADNMQPTSDILQFSRGPCWQLLWNYLHPTSSVKTLASTSIPGENWEFNFSGYVEI